MEDTDDGVAAAEPPSGKFKYMPALSICRRQFGRDRPVNEPSEPSFALLEFGSFI